MIRNITCLVVFLLAFTTSFAQSSLNDYKYVIVPNKYEFLKSADEYRLNWLTKSLFENLKFKAVMNDVVLPEELKSNVCLALKADVLNDSKLFKTKLKIQLKNCDGEIVYTSEEGVSREKNYKKAYHEALRMAFKFLEAENYSYIPNEAVIAKALVSNQEEVQEIKKLKEEIKELKAKKTEKPEKTVKTAAVEATVIPIVKMEKKVAKSKNNKQTENIKTTVSNNRLTAALIEGSLNYIIKDNNGEVIYTLLFSGKPDLYMVKGIDALVYKINNAWAMSQYIGKDLQIKSLDLKF